MNTKLLFLVLLVALTSLSVHGQDDPITIDTELVNVPVSVSDKSGKPVPGLKKEDFQLFENGRATEVSFFSGNDSPVSYGIVYDLHPTSLDETETVLRALDTFADSLRAGDDFFLTVFNEYGSLDVNFVPNTDQIRRHLSFGERNEPNSLYDAAFFAGEKLKSRRNQKKTLIIISDGKDHGSHHSFSELERLLKSFSVQIFGVILESDDRWKYGGITDDEVDRLDIEDSALEKAAIAALSRETGGDASSPQLKNTVELYKILDRIGRETRSVYSLGFYPTAKGKVKVRVELTESASKARKLGFRKSYEIIKRKKEQP